MAQVPTETADCDRWKLVRRGRKLQAVEQRAILRELCVWREAAARSVNLVRPALPSPFCANGGV